MLRSIALISSLLVPTFLFEGRLMAAISPESLRCEYKTDPAGIDQTKPRLDWKLVTDQPDARGQRQSAYQILVASSEANLTKDLGDLWDSGKVTSDETTQIVYSGKPLLSEQRPFWKVRIWDGQGQAAGWSKQARFTMGLLNSSDWKAKWIGYDEPVPELRAAEAEASTETLTLEGLSWISADGWTNGPQFFRTIVNLPEGEITKSHAVITADNGFDLFVNGNLVGSGDDWHKPRSLQYGQFLKPGNNVFAIAVRHQTSGPAGLIGRFRIKVGASPSMIIDIDANWQVNTQDRPGWNSTVNPPDPGTWRAAKAVVRYGDDPWGRPPVRLLNLPPPPYLRKQFTINKPVARATVYASALGLYELHLNGQRVGTDHLTPGWTEYSKRVHYQSYDVTPVLKQGPNSIGAILGDGWYASYWYSNGTRDIYGKEPRLIAQLNIEYADGTRESIGTDPSWKATYGPLREADFLMGCTCDASMELNGWDNIGYDDSRWQAISVTDRVAAVLQASPGPPVKAIEEVAAKTVTSIAPGTYVFDLGQNIVGWARLKLPSTRAGQKIVLRHAEMLNPDKTLYTVALRSARATDTYISKGGAVTWEPTFTFHGFRYVEVSGLDSPPALDAVTGIVVHSEMQPTGSFECSNPLVNQLVKNIIWGQKGNYLEVPTDCPQRDERLGWTGDAQFFIPTAAYNFDVSAFFSKWLVDLNEDAVDEDGAFSSTAPDMYRDKSRDGATAWADAGIICPYNIYKYYGDKRIIEDHYTSMAKYIDYVQKTSKDYIRGQGIYGDWVNLGGGAKSEVIGTAYSEHVTRLMSEMAAAIGKDTDAKKYKDLADRIRQVFIREFVLPDGHIKESSQTGYALAFAFDLIPAELRTKSADAFAEEIKNKDWHLATGFIGTPRLLPALSMAGRDDIAYRLLLTETYPSWLFQVKLGATTMWERWDGWTPEKGFQNPGMNSFNHYAFGSVGQWLYQTVGGIVTDGPGYKKITIHPQPNPSLTFAKAGYDSIRGQISSEWKMQGQMITLSATVPVNTTATIYVPTRDPASVRESGQAIGAGRGIELLRAERGAAVYRVVSGRYEFTAMN